MLGELLEAEVQRLKSESQEKTSKNSDPEKEKLEAMTPTELKTLKKQVRLAQIRAGEDDSKLGQLMELEDKIEEVMSTAPQKFAQNQIAKFNEAVASTVTELENFDSIKDELFNYASTIYKAAPEFQSSINGQARAWKLAVDHYSALSKLTTGKSKVAELERKVNTLKKKTSLDTAVQKGNAKMSDESKLYNRAKGGTETDKMEFLKRRMNTDSFIPEEFRQ